MQTQVGCWCESKRESGRVRVCEGTAGVRVQDVEVLCRRVSGDEVVTLRGSRTSSGMGLTVKLPLHEEVALLFKVGVTVSAHKAAGVAVFVPGLHYCPPVDQ